MNRELRQLVLGVIPAIAIAGCGSTGRMGETTINGVKVQVAASEIAKTKIVMDGSRLVVNGQRYGTVKAGDLVEVTGAGVAVNGVTRSKESSPSAH